MKNSLCTAIFDGVEEDPVVISQVCGPTIILFNCGARDSLHCYNLYILWRKLLFCAICALRYFLWYAVRTFPQRIKKVPFVQSDKRT